MLIGGDNIMALNPIRKQNYSMEKAVGKTTMLLSFIKASLLKCLNRLFLEETQVFFILYQ